MTGERIWSDAHERQRRAALYEADMRLPEGKACGDCVNHPYCLRLFGCAYGSETCDWSPSRFRAKEGAPRG